jgi:hypothetical protein
MKRPLAPRKEHFYMPGFGPDSTGPDVVSQTDEGE